MMKKDEQQKRGVDAREKEPTKARSIDQRAPARSVRAFPHDWWTSYPRTKYVVATRVASAIRLLLVVLLSACSPSLRQLQELANTTKENFLLLEACDDSLATIQTMFYC
jgi:hypothetical protein